MSDRRYANIMRVPPRCGQIDMQEVLKQEILSQADTPSQLTPILPGTDRGPVVPLQPPFGVPAPRPIGFIDEHIYFDSRFANGASDRPNGELRWSVPDLNNTQQVSNCVEMNLGEFYFPRIVTSASVPDFFYARRAFMELQTVSSTAAVMAPNNSRFHFEFEVSNLDSGAVLFTPLRDSFFFPRPVTAISDFNVRFTVPSGNIAAPAFKRIPIPVDVAPIAAVVRVGPGVGYNPAQFEFTDGVTTTAVIGPVGVLPAPGVAIYISNYDGFFSSVPSFNDVVNRPEGWFVTEILDDTTFVVGGLDLDFEDAVGGGQMHIPKNRVAFPVRFTSVRDQNTNYMEIGHL